MLQQILDNYPEEIFLIADGYDDAVIGVDEESMRLIYSVAKCIEILSQQMDQEDAEEYFEFNTRGAFIGDKTPIWCDDNF